MAMAFPSEVTLDAVSLALHPLSAEGRPPLLAPSRPVVFELHLQARQVSWRVGAEEAALRRLLPGIREALPGVVVEPAERTSAGRPGAACELRLVSARRPLDVSRPEVLAHRLLSLSARLGVGERLVVQWVVGPWLPRSPVRPVSEQTQRRTVWNVDEWGRPVLDTEEIQQARKKQAEHLYGCVGRVAVWGASGSRARQLASEAAGAYQLLRAPGVGFSRRWLPKGCVAARLDRLVVPRLVPPCRLMTSELAAVIGWPIGNPELVGVSYRRSRLVAPDERTLVPVEAAGRYRVLGDSASPERPGAVVLPAELGLRHLHVVGPTGSGKSWLLANLILADIAAGRGTVVIDAKGDLVTDVLARLPTEARSRVVLMDPTDLAPVGLNPLAGGDLAVDGLVHVMRSVWAASWGPRLGDILHAGALTLARSPGHTLAELPVLLTDDAFRRAIVRQATAADPVGIGSFWAWYDALTPDARMQVLGPVMNKLRSFLLRPDLRAVLGQPEPRFDLTQVFSRRRVLLVRLGRGQLGAEGAQLLGSLLVTSLWQRALARSALPAERRPPVFVYLDEFQEFLRLNIDLGDALAQARGLGVGLVLAHQHLGQLDSGVRSAVLANAASRVVFGLDVDDATIIARRTGGALTTEDLSSLPAFQAYARVPVADGPGRYASIRTRALPAPSVDVARFEAENRRSWGVDRTETEARLQRLVTGPSKDGPEGPLGAVRRPGGRK